jgi:uncharacterized protein (TIRG00374 family)
VALRRALGAAAGVASLVLLAPVLGHVYAALGSVRDADSEWVIAAVVCEAAAFVSAWTLQRLLLRADRWRDVAVPQLVGNAASNLLPAGSALGTVLQVRLLWRRGIDLTRSVMALAFAGLLTALAGLILFPLIALAPVGDSALSARDAVPLSIVFLAVGLLLLFVALRGDRPMRFVARNVHATLRHISWCRPPEDLATRIVHERDEIRYALRRRRSLAMVTASGHVIGDYLALYATLLAVGIRPSPAVVLAAFLAANAAGMVPITPGGLGFVEAGLTGTLVLAGADTNQALTAVATYRLVSCWIPVAAGLASYGWSSGLALRGDRLPSDRGGAHERPVATETRSHDARAASELEPRDRVELGLRGREERFAESERDGSGDYRETKVEQVHHRADDATDERSGSFDHVGGRFFRRPSRDGADGRTRGFSLQAAARTTRAQPPVRDDDDVPDVARVAGGSVE